MEQLYMTRLAEVYQRGYEVEYAGVGNPPEMKMHYFKTKEALPRVQVVLGFLQGIVPAGHCNSLLDVESGRGVFLFPLLREFPNLEVTSVDILSHRVELLDRMKYVRASFLQTVEESQSHWLDRPIVPNRITVPITELFI